MSTLKIRKIKKVKRSKKIEKCNNANGCSLQVVTHGSHLNDIGSHTSCPPPEPCHSSEHSEHEHHHDHCCDPKPHGTNCAKREYRDHTNILREKLGDLQYKKCECKPLENNEEKKYKQYNYNGLFHKGLDHNSDGTLKYPEQYEDLRNSIVYNNQVELASVPLAPNAKGKFVNPLASWSSVLAGAPQCTLTTVLVPTLSSDEGAAEMIELYSMELVRDVQFKDYSTSPSITNLLTNTRMNYSSVLAHLPLYKPINVAFTPTTLFRGISLDEHVGPYVSQLLYLNVPMGGVTLQQKYKSPKPVLVSPGPSASRVEWGVNQAETVLIQNTQLMDPGLPAATLAGDILSTYIYSGRSLAEAVHNDPAFYFFFNAALTLGSLGVSPNPGMPVYPNQVPFISGNGGPSVQCNISEVTGLALKHSWYWKWQCYRRQRPEAFALGVDVVKNNPSENSKYEISDVALLNDILVDIQAYHAAAPYSFSNSYTLSQAYREGSPLHPAFPSGHATIAGACCTVLKIFYDAEKPWNSLPGVISNSLSGGVSHPVQADTDGAALIQYIGSDASSMTISGEIDKLASNVAFGRNWSGIHYRSDAIGGLLLGEEVAIKYMEDVLSTMVENNLDGSVPEVTFRKFDGTFATIKPTVCSTCN